MSSGAVPIAGFFGVVAGMYFGIRLRERNEMFPYLQIFGATGVMSLHSHFFLGNSPCPPSGILFIRAPMFGFILGTFFALQVKSDPNQIKPGEEDRYY